MTRWFDLSKYDVELYARGAAVELGGAVIISLIGGLANRVEGAEWLSYVIWAVAVVSGIKGVFDLGRSYGISEIRDKYDETK